MAQMIDSKEQEKVLRSFFKDGQLLALPAKYKKRLYVLSLFARRFDQGRDYLEAQVNACITPVFSDYCTIRRELVEYGFMSRGGNVYRRLQEDGWLPGY